MKKLYILLLSLVFPVSLSAQIRSFVGADYSQGKVFIMEEGRIVWEHTAPDCNDVWSLPNGNILFTTGKGVLELTRSKEVVFRYESDSPVFACQRLANGNTFIGECATGRLLELSPEGNLISEVCILPEGVADGGFAFMRNARRLDNGHYLVAHYGDETVKEYDRTGKIVWEIFLPGGPHSVMRLPYGNTLVAVADKNKDPRLVELDRKGNIVWEFSNKDVPDNSLKFLGGFHYFTNGEILFTNWTGHEKTDARSHLYLINREKDILYRLKDTEGIHTMSSVSCIEREPQKTYRNPVVAYSLPDPTIQKDADGYFYLYATEDIRNLPIHRSKDLVNWEFTGTAFTSDTRPRFEPRGGIWAPDINYINGQYVLYYSMSVWGGEWTCGIGVATADRPEGPFTDHGMLFRSNTIDVQNSIDQFYIEEDGKKYLFWGSFRGLYVIELSDDGLTLKSGAEKKRVAGTAYEGVYIHKKDGYYYMFASIGSCCEGVNSTYTTVVGRSKELFGPYLDKSGQSMMDNHHEILIQKNDRFVGTGHNSEIVTDDAGNDWFFYHAVDINNPRGRVLVMDQVKWVDGWPVVDGQTTSLEAPAPAFKNR